MEAPRYAFESGLAVAWLSILHILFPRFDRAARDSVHLWVPLSAGVALGYVFLFVMPELADFTMEILEHEPDAPEFFQYRMFLFSLLGVMAYLLIDRFGSQDDAISHHARQIQGVGFCVYNALMGYLVSDMPRGGSAVPVLLADVTLTLHFLGINHQLRHTHPDLFDRRLRWLLAISVWIGWTVGVSTELSHVYFATATAFISGSIVVNVMAEELPEGRPSSMAMFILGTAIFVAISVIGRSYPRIGH